MGYYSTVSGEINIERVGKVVLPSELEAAVKKYGFDVVNNNVGNRFSDEAREKFENDSTLNFFLVMNSDGDMIMSAGDSGKAYDFLDAVKTLIAIAKEDGVLLTGELLVEGEDFTDQTRYVISRNNLEVYKATVIVEWKLEKQVLITDAH